MCRMHGGAKGAGAPKGKGNGQWRHGGWTAEAIGLRREASALLQAISKAGAQGGPDDAA